MAKNQTKAVLDNFTIKSYVDGLLESNAGSNPRLSHFLSEYQKVLAEGATKEFMLYEEFGHGLANFASNNKAVKKVINEMNTNLATYGKELNTYKLMECICDDAAKCACEDAYTHYLASNDAQSKAILTSAVDVLEQTGDPVAPQLTVIIANPNAQLEPQQISTFDSESKFNEIQRKIEEDKLRQKVEDAKAEIDAYAEKKYAEIKAQEEAERSALVFDNVVNANGICLGESIKNIMNSDAKSNKKLVETLEQYKGALNQGLYEERLYEGFIKNVTPFNYLTAVNKELKRLEKIAEEKEAPINITKILEEMSATNSYYILQLIEEDACRFIKNPTDVNCNQLKAALVAYSGDPYCRAIMEELERFNDKPAFLVNDAAMTIKDRAKLIKEHANISNIYSPVQYIKEGECVFNANGQFYVKKGNTLAKLSEEYVPQLSENFISLCRLVNDPHVIMNEDHITLVGNGKIANIYESYIDINGNKETKETVRDLSEMQLKYDFDNNFFIMTSCLAENFDNIANINFGKHVALNEDEGIHIDLFNLSGNIFVNAVNESMLTSTFYHNVNPIQCRNLINNHMGINVSSLFEELIPSQDKLYLKLNETKSEYEASIAKYEATIEKLKKAKEENISEDSEKKLDAAIEAAESKVEELKKEYKDWQDDVDKVTNPENKASDKKEKDNDEDPEDVNTEEEKSNEPIDPEDVEAAKADLSTPISQEAGSLNVTDDEFDTYLEGDSEVPGDEMDNTEVNMSHHALNGDGKENQEPNPDELDNPMIDENPEETPEEIGDENTLPEVNTEDEEDPFETEINATSDEEPINFNDEESTPEEQVESPVEDEHSGEIQTTNVPEGYKIAAIQFDQNVKTGEIFKTGNITIMTDMVGENGMIHTETKAYPFYIDTETHLPVIDVAEIPVALYNALVASIQADEKFNDADANGIEAQTQEEPKADEVYYNADDVNQASDELQKDDEEGYFDFKDEPDGSLTISAKEETPAVEPAPEETSVPAETPNPEDAPEGEDVIPAENEPKPVKASDLFKGVEDEPDEEEVITPTYKVDDTVIDKPADNIEFEEPEESTEELSFDSDEKDFPDFDDVNIEEEPAETHEENKEENSEEESAEGDASLKHMGIDPKLEDNDNAPDEQKQVNESVKSNSKITINEAKAAFVKLTAEFKKGDQSFIIEGASKPSKKEVNSLNEGETPQNNEQQKSKVEEENKEIQQKSVINELHKYAQENAENPVEISEVKSFNDITYFSINNIPNKDNMAIYEMDNKIYYGNYEDLSDVMDGITLGVNSKKDLELLESEQPQCVSSELIEDGYDLINTILGESCKIKKPGLSSNGDINASQKMAEILDGTKDRQEFEKKVERETEKAGVPNPLIPQPQQESVNVEDANELSESVVDKENIEIIYEPMDWVIIKENGMKAQVTNVVNDGDGNLKMITIVASNGVSYNADPDEIEPDPMYLANLPGSVINSTLLGVSRLATFDINPQTRLTDIVNNDDPALDEKYKDFND